MKATASLWNVLTVMLLGLTVMVCLCVGVTFANPYHPLNPLKPPLRPDQLTPASFLGPTGTPVTFPTLPPEWTAVATSSPSPTRATTVAPPTSTQTEQPAAFGPAGTQTDFPTAVGPTSTLTPTDNPTRTPTRPAPTRTPTIGPYPGDSTGAPPTGYP